jgi:vesicle coat complex subunit
MSIVAAFQESIGPAVPQVIALLSHNHEYVRRAGADALGKLSEQGKISNVLVWDC